MVVQIGYILPKSLTLSYMLPVSRPHGHVIMTETIA